MYDTLEPVNKAITHINEYNEQNCCLCCEPIFPIEVSAHVLLDLLRSLTAHPHVMESTCGDCEEIQNGVNALCENITEQLREMNEGRK